MTDMTNAAVKRNDQFAWGLAAVSFIYLALSFINVIVANAVMVVLSIMFVRQDRKVLLAEGLVAPNFWWWLLPFVYLIRRGKLNNLPLWKKVGWGSVVVYIAIVIGSTLYEMRDTGDLAAEGYCSTVTRIISQRNSSVTCLKVKDVTQVSDKNYRAVAMLSNGNDVNITIEYKDGDNYYVTAYGL